MGNALQSLHFTAKSKEDLASILERLSARSMEFHEESDGTLRLKDPSGYLLYIHPPPSPSATS
eukprot:gene8365-9219_t